MMSATVHSHFGLCPAYAEWVEDQTQPLSAHDAWMRCPRGVWMVELLDALLARVKIPAYRPLLVLAVAGCIHDVLPLVTTTNRAKVREALTTVERWVFRGTDKELKGVLAVESGLFKATQVQGIDEVDLCVLTAAQCLARCASGQNGYARQALEHALYARHYATDYTDEETNAGHAETVRRLVPWVMLAHLLCACAVGK